MLKGMGGAMDLVSSVKRIIVVMSLNNKKGGLKLRKNIDLPLTGKNCVSTLISEHGVFNFTHNGIILTEVSKDSSIENIRTLTDIDFRISDNLGLMEDNSSKYDPGQEDEDIFET